MNAIKQIYDPVHGFIPVSQLMVQIMDTQEFQRLRDLKQLGAAYFVFPSATHSRLEHSIGVSFLARETMISLQQRQPELNITARLIELVQIAGLIHDLGHGPYSHLYDDYVREPDEPEHEERGCSIFKSMTTIYSLSLTSDEIDMIIKMICPSPEDNWIYQIVANTNNQIDVDKIDYIMRDSYHLGLQTGGEFRRIITQCRVIDDIICYPKKVNYDIYALFAARYRLHKQVYHHHAVVAYEFIIIEILKEIKKTNPQFLDLTDSVVTCRLHSRFKPQLDKIAKRQHWRLAGEKRITKTATYALWRCDNPDPSKYRFHQFTIGFVSGQKSNPLDDIWFYSDNNPTEKYKLDPRTHSFIIPKEYQETILRIYVKDKADKETAAEILTSITRKTEKTPSALYDE